MFKVWDNKVLHDFTFTFTVVNKARAENPDLSGFSFRNILYCKPQLYPVGRLEPKALLSVQCLVKRVVLRSLLILVKYWL